MASPVTSNYELSIEYDVETINISIRQPIRNALKRMIIFTIFISRNDNISLFNKFIYQIMQYIFALQICWYIETILKQTEKTYVL